MAPDYASAVPRKHFFLEMFTRDITLTDCILDLVDNSIDSQIRRRDIDVSSALWDVGSSGRRRRKEARARIDVALSKERLEVVDNCGGIPFSTAKTDVFNFGHPPGHKSTALGVYGIGLKRAVFKLGRLLVMQSKSEGSGFELEWDLDKWAKHDERLEDWRIPIKETKGATKPEEAGTSVSIRRLNPSIRTLLDAGKLEPWLRDAISKAYAFFLGKHVDVYVNGDAVTRLEIPLGESKRVVAGRDEFDHDGVHVEIYATIASRGPERWAGSRAGWYVVCNGRLVLAADKTELTGWSGVDLPLFHSKYTGFIGVVSFHSSEPLSLPWTTTKRDLDREASVFLKTRNRMTGVAKPVLSFLSSMYPSELVSEPEQRAIAKDVKTVPLKTIKERGPSSFRVDISGKRRTYDSVSVQYKASLAEVQRIRRRLRNMSMPANKIGRKTFDYYLEQECPE